MTRSDEVFLIASTGSNSGHAGSPGAGNDGCMHPLTSLRSIQTGAGVLILTFEGSANVDVVTLSCIADELKAAKQLTRICNNAGRNTQSNVIVLANGPAATATVTVCAEITGCTTIA